MKFLLPIIVILFLINTRDVFAQDSLDENLEQNSNSLKVFLFCPQGGCDQDYVRTQLTLFNFVRDRFLADVQILTTLQQAGNNGLEYTLNFIGLGRFTGMTDTLTFNTLQADTDDMIRNKLVRTIKLGLIRYVAKTIDADKATINFNQPAITENPKSDPWKSWVFNINLNGFFEGEKQRNFLNLFGSISATRVTPEWKYSIGHNWSYSESTFDFDNFKDASYLRSQGVNAYFSKSMGEHFSLGGFFDASSSTFSNIRLRLELSPAIEYNYFPYSENTRQQLRFTYRIGGNRFVYGSETIFDKLEETIGRHALSITLDLRQAWGTLIVSIDNSQYLNDLSKYRNEFFVEMNLRIIEGFSVTFFGSYSRVRDQISLQKSTIGNVDAILQRVQLATSYNYFSSIGLRYTFGSIYNNVVNPRFGR